MVRPRSSTWRRHWKSFRDTRLRSEPHPRVREDADRGIAPRSERAVNPRARGRYTLVALSTLIALGEPPRYGEDTQTMRRWFPPTSVNPRVRGRHEAGSGSVPGGLGEPPRT